MKSVVSLIYDFFVCAIGWSSVSTNDDILSVGLSQPETIGLPTGVSLLRRRCLGSSRNAPSPRGGSVA